MTGPAGTRVFTRLNNLLLIGLGVLALLAPDAVRADTTLPEPPGQTRTELLLSDLRNPVDIGLQPVHNSNFLPVSDHAGALEPFEGRLTVTSSNTLRREPGSEQTLKGLRFPPFTVEFITEGNNLVPATRGVIRTTDGRSAWNIILDPGRIWSEAADDGWSRASFPFTLTRPLRGPAFNGIATFAYRQGQVSQLRFQTVQETSPFQHLDAWGSAVLDYDPALTVNRERLAADFAAEQAAGLAYRPWSDLIEQYGSDLMDRFDGDKIRKNISLSALVIDGKAYRTGCRTRFGAYPYCRYMRHGVYSMTKTMVAAAALYRLAEKYGGGVLDQKVIDHVDLLAEHDGWTRVTFAHAISMVTGIGDSTPRKVDYYVNEDSGPVMEAVVNAPSAKSKIGAAAKADKYPWGPGVEFRYRTVDTIVLMAAMDAYLKSREGPDANLWDMLTREVFNPMGVYHLSTLHTVETEKQPGLPVGGYGLYATLDDVVKIARLFQNGGRHDNQQLLYAAPILDVVRRRKQGKPVGLSVKDGTIHYLNSFWISPYLSKAGCRAQVPAMSGLGGNFALLMPNRTIAIRFADGPYEAETYNSHPMRLVSDTIRPLCNG